MELPAALWCGGQARHGRTGFGGLPLGQRAAAKSLEVLRWARLSHPVSRHTATLRWARRSVKFLLLRRSYDSSYRTGTIDDRARCASP